MVPSLFQPFAFVLTLLVASSWAEVGAVQLKSVVFGGNLFPKYLNQSKCLPAPQNCAAGTNCSSCLALEGCSWWVNQKLKCFQGCDLKVGKIMYPKITSLMSKKLKIMYIFQK